jgi:hypothetical protein
MMWKTNEMGFRQILKMFWLKMDVLRVEYRPLQEALGFREEYFKRKVRGLSENGSRYSEVV